MPISPVRAPLRSSSALLATVGSVHHLGDVGAVDRVLGDEGGDAFHDGAGVVVDAGGDFSRRDRAILGQENDIGEGAPDIDADAVGAHALLSGAVSTGGISPREDCRRRGPPSCGPQFRPARLGCGMIDPPRGAIDDHAVVIARSALTDQLVAQVAQHGLRIALQRIAPAAGAGELVAEDIAMLDGLGELARQGAFVRPRIHRVARGLAGAPAIEPVGAEGVAVGAHLEQPF